MIAKLFFFFFCGKTEAMVLIWTPPAPKTHVSLLKKHFPVLDRANWEGRLIQEGCQWEPGPGEILGGEGAHPAWGCAHPAPAAPAGQGGQGNPPGMAQPVPPVPDPQGRAEVRLCLGKGSVWRVWGVTQKERGVRAHLLIAATGTGFALPEEIFLIFPSFTFPSTSFGPSWTLRSPSNLVFWDELFLLYYLHNFFSAWY